MLAMPQKMKNRHFAPLSIWPDLQELATVALMLAE
jgi:hypothetical protein